VHGTYDLAGSTYTIAADDTVEFFKIIDSVGGGTLQMEEGANLIFDDLPGCGFDWTYRNWRLVVQATASTPAHIYSEHTHPTYPWLLPWPGISVTAYRCVFTNYTGTFGSTWILVHCDKEVDRVPVYCHVEDVVARLMLCDINTGARKVLDETTNPKYSEVEDRIFAMEDYLDRACWDRWRIQSSDIEYYGVDNLWPGWFPHELLAWVNGRNLQNFSAAEGDILKIRRGDVWTDLLDGTKVEQIGQDFWVEYGYGIIHFYRTRPQYGNEQIMVKYRWGNTIVPYDIKRACTNLVAADLLEGELYAVVAGDGSGFATNRDSTIKSWRAEADQIIMRHKRQPMSMLGF